MTVQLSNPNKIRVAIVNLNLSLQLAFVLEGGKFFLFFSAQNNCFFVWGFFVLFHVLRQSLNI
jgi:hypothetical protein